MHAGRFGNGVRRVTAVSGRAQSREAALPDIRQAMECYLESADCCSPRRKRAF